MAKLNKIAVTFPTKIGPSEEKALAKIYTALEKAWSDVAGLLSDVRKTTPMPKSLDDDITKRETLSKGRKAELKDLEKADKKGELHTNPAKLQRLYKDLNEDIAQANWLEGGVDNAVDDHFALDVVKLLAEAKADLPKGVTAGAVDLAEMALRSGSNRWSGRHRNFK